MRFHTLSLLMLLTSLTHAQVQWIRQGGVGGDGQSVATDAEGNCYVVGDVSNPTYFEDDTLATHFADVFVAKYDDAGNLQWLHSGGDNLVDRANDVAADAQGNAYVTGFYSTSNLTPSVAFGDTVITGSGSTELFLAKYAADGTLLWIRHGGGVLADEGRGVALLPNGRIAVSGMFQGTATFSGQTLTSAGQSDVCILQYDANGDLMDAWRAGGPGDDQPGRITALPDNGVALVGRFQQDAQFGSTQLTAHGLGDLFIAAYHADGTIAWAASGGSDVSFASDFAYDIARAPNGDLVLCGQIADDATVAGTTLTTNGSADVVVARYAADGTPLWAHHGGGTEQDIAYGIDVDEDGACYVTGQADSGPNTTFDTITLDPFGNDAVFLAKYDAGGAVQWVRRYAPGLGFGVCTIGGGCLYLSGSASGTVGQPAFDDQLWLYTDRAVFTARFCDGISSGTQEVLPPAGVPVFPNPVSDVLHVVLNGDHGTYPELRLFDACGRSVRTVQPIGSLADIDVSSLMNGCYELRAQGTGGLHMQRVIVAH